MSTHSVPEHDQHSLPSSDTSQGVETVWSAFVDVVRTQPEAVAITGERGELTYRQLHTHADAVATHLVQHGVGPGDRVALLCQRDALVPAAMLGIVSIGAVFVPIETDAPAARRAQVLDLAACGATISNLPSEERPKGCLDLEVISRPTSESRSVANLHITSEDAASVMFTSGSTGQPKGVVIPHRAIVRLARAGILDLGPVCRFLHASSLAFDASTLEIWGPLLNGGTVVTMEPKPDLKLIERAFREQSVTAAWLTAALFHLCADTSPSMFEPLTTLLTGGDVVSPKHAAAVLAANPHLRLINGYGPTENTTFTTTYHISDPDPGTPLPIGRPIRGTGVVIVNEDLEPVPNGEAGELVTTGAGLALGYLHDPDLSAARFVTLPSSGEYAYRTGDLVLENDHGLIEFLGRADDQVKINGFRVEPAEIEAALRRIEGVLDAAVVSWSNGQDPVLHAFVLAEHPNRWYALQTRVRLDLAKELPVYLRPGSMSREETLPRTASGKVDRRQLRRLLEQGVPVRQPGPEGVDRVTSAQLLAIGAVLTRRWHPHDDDAEFSTSAGEARIRAAAWDDRIDRLGHEPPGIFDEPGFTVSIPLPTGGHAVLQRGPDLTARFPPFTSQLSRMWLMHHAARVTEAVISGANLSVGEIDILCAHELEHVTSVWNETDEPIDTSRSLIDIILDRCRMHPDLVALQSEWESVTYGRIESEIRSIAAAIRAVDPAGSGAVTVVDERSISTIVSVLGVLASGRACLPLHAATPAERARAMLSAADTRVMLIAGEAVPPDESLRILRYTDIRDAVSTPVLQPIDPMSTAFVLFTSGSTGMPKGVPIRHESLVNRVLWQARALEFTENDVVAQKNQLSWDVSMWEYLLPLTIGARCVVLDSATAADPRRLVAAARRMAISAWHLVPSMIVPVADAAGAAPPAIRATVCSGEVLSPAAAARFLSRVPCCLHNLYGPTEAAIDVTHWWCDPDADAVPIGRPVANTRISIVDPNGRPCPAGIPGELVLHGIQVSHGYINNPDKSAESFIPCAHNPGRKAYQTGDLGWWRDDGAVCFRGRIDDQMKVFGFRIEPGDIETALLETGLVSDAAVCVVIAGSERTIAAVCATVTGQRDTPDESVFTALRNRLEGYAVPSRIIWTDRVPRLPNGKIDRRSAGTLAQSAVEADATSGFAAEKHEIRDIVRAVWTKLLGHPPASDNTDFISAGGNSLLLLRVFLQLEQLTSIQLHTLPSLQNQTPASIIQAFRNAIAHSKLCSMSENGFEIQANYAGHLYKLTDGPQIILAVPHLGGTLGFLSAAASILDQRAALHGIRQTGLLADEQPLDRADRMIEGYAQLVTNQGWKNLKIVGYSSGASFVVDLAHRLVSEGIGVDNIYLVDGIPCHRPALPARFRSLYTKVMWRVPYSFIPLRAPNTRPYDMSGYKDEQLKLAQATIAALFRHTPAQYRGNATVIHTDRAVSLAYADSWKRLLKGPIEEVVLAGAHHSNIWDPPFVQTVVKVLLGE